jgi:hypothetical protein
MATVKAFKFAGVTESLKINRGILGEVRMLKHTYKAYKTMIKVEIK